MRACGLKYPVVGVVLTTVKNLTGPICKKMDQFDFLFLFLFNVIAHFESSSQLRPRLRFGLQSLGLAQKALLLLMI
jgi:hypothetical protein